MKLLYDSTEAATCFIQEVEAYSQGYRLLLWVAFMDRGMPCFPVPVSAFAIIKGKQRSHYH